MAQKRQQQNKSSRKQRNREEGTNEKYDGQERLEETKSRQGRGKFKGRKMDKIGCFVLDEFRSVIGGREKWM